MPLFKELKRKSPPNKGFQLAHYSKKFQFSLGSVEVGLAIFLGREACRQGKRVSFQTTATIVISLTEAGEEKSLLKLQKKLKTVDLLIIDEPGYIPLSQSGAQLLFGVFAERYEQGSIVVTTNL